MSPLPQTPSDWFLMEDCLVLKTFYGFLWVMGESKKGIQLSIVHKSIFALGRGRAGANPNCLWREAGSPWVSHQFVTGPIGHRTFVFGQWKETGVHRENPLRPGENVWAAGPCSSWGLNQGPSYCEVTTFFIHGVLKVCSLTCSSSKVTRSSSSPDQAGSSIIDDQPCTFGRKNDSLPVQTPSPDSALTRWQHIQYHIILWI